MQDGLLKANISQFPELARFASVLETEGSELSPKVIAAFEYLQQRSALRMEKGGESFLVVENVGELIDAVLTVVTANSVKGKI